jgi:hypothetical protein
MRAAVGEGRGERVEGGWMCGVVVGVWVGWSGGCMGVRVCGLGVWRVGGCTFL